MQGGRVVSCSKGWRIPSKKFWQETNEGYTIIWHGDIYQRLSHRHSN